ncbi:MAG: hypothetical protein ACRD2N_04095 [Vicinamibacterales bacterium]
MPSELGVRSRGDTPLGVSDRLAALAQMKYTAIQTDAAMKNP